MKVLKALIFLLVVIVAIAFLVPADKRIGYWGYYYGRALELTGDVNGASDSFKSSTDAMPDDVTFFRAYARSLNDIGEKFDNAGSYQAAYDFVHQWMIDHPDDPEIWQAYIELARAEWGKGRKNPAQIAIDKAVNLKPTDYIALVYQGIIYRDIRPTSVESVRLSIPIFEQALQVRNNTRTYWAEYELGKAWWMIHDEAHALAEIDQALSQFPPRWLREEAERLKHEIESSGRSER
jgi:tetratricopeptide (TPR) repeat protein